MDASKGQRDPSKGDSSALVVYHPRKRSTPMQRYLAEHNDAPWFLGKKGRTPERMDLAEKFRMADESLPKSGVSVSTEDDITTLQHTSAPSEEASSIPTSIENADPVGSQLIRLFSEQDDCPENSSSKSSGSSYGNLWQDVDVWEHVALQEFQPTASLMRNVSVIFNSEWKVYLRNRGGSASASSNEHSQETLQSDSGALTSRNNKRRVPDRGFSPPGEDNGKGKRRARSKHGPEDGLLYACPFYKHDPHRYSPIHDYMYRPCAGPGFQNVARIKQHLRLKHSPPPHQCSTCWTVTSSGAELETHHQNADQQCQPGLRPPSAGADQIKLELIKKQRGISWGGIYEILFPGEAIPSPYHEHYGEQSDLPGQDPIPLQELQDLHARVRRVVHSEVERLLQDVTATAMIGIEEHIRPRLVQIVRTTISAQLQNVPLNNLQSPLPPSISPENHPLQTFASTQANTQTAPMEETTYTTSTEMAGPFSSNTRATSPTLGPSHDGNKPAAYPSAIADLVSTSLTTDCDCLCHIVSNPIKAAFEKQSCEDCSFMHLDSYSSNLGGFEDPFLGYEGSIDPTLDLD